MSVTLSPFIDALRKEQRKNPARIKLLFSVAPVPRTPLPLSLSPAGHLHPTVALLSNLELPLEDKPPLSRAVAILECQNAFGYNRERDAFAIRVYDDPVD